MRESLVSIYEGICEKYCVHPKGTIIEILREIDKQIVRIDTENIRTNKRIDELERRITDIAEGNPHA